MSNTTRRTALSLLLLLLAAGPLAAQKRYPTSGSIDYDGRDLVYFWMNWERPGSWTVSDPGYEHNLEISRYYWDACTSLTDLPYAYSDCGTTGKSESDPNRYVFGFGSFHAVKDYRYLSRHLGDHQTDNKPPIHSTPNTWYWGSITFRCVGSCYEGSTTFNLYAQEVASVLCLYPNDYARCMNGTAFGGANGLMSGTWTYGTPYYREYRYDPVSGQRLY